MKPMQAQHRYYATTTSGGKSVVKGFKYEDFDSCEMCGGTVFSPFGWGSSYDTVYTCNDCGFRKLNTHVSFGFFVKIPNYHSITLSHSSNRLFFSDGSTIESRIEKHENIYGRDASVVDQKWNMWIKENTIEIVKLAAIADTKTIGSDTTQSYDRNPMIHLKEHIKEKQGNYLNFVKIKLDRSNRRYQKIGHAISYGLKNCKSVIWLGSKNPETIQEEIMNSAAVRLNRKFTSFKLVEHLINGQTSTLLYNEEPFSPVYVTGPAMIDVNVEIKDMTQLLLDDYVDKHMTSIYKELPDEQKFKVIINTGNSGIDTSVIRWAVKNKIYVVVVNLSNIMYLDKRGFNRYDTVESATERLLNIDAPDYSEYQTMELI